MLTRVSRSALRVAQRQASAAPRFAQVAFFSEASPVKDELANSPKVQTVLDQILALNMIEIAELSAAIQVSLLRCLWLVLALSTLSSLQQLH